METVPAAAAVTEDEPKEKPGIAIPDGKLSFSEALKQHGKPAEPAKPTETPAAVADPEDAPPEVKSEVGKSSWNKLKTEKAQLLKERDELKAKTATFESETARLNSEIAAAKAAHDPEEVARLRAERDDIKKQLKLKDITALPEWKQTFTEPLSAKLKSAISAVPAEHQKNAEYILGLPESDFRTQQLEALAEGMTPLRAGQFASAIMAVDEIRGKMAAVLADQDKVISGYETFAKANKERETAIQMKQRTEALARVRREIEEANLPVFTKRDGDDAYNKTVEANLAEAEQYAALDDPADRAKLAHWAVFGSKIKQPFLDAIARAEKAEAELARIRAAAPTGGKTVSGGVKPDAPKMFSELVTGTARR